MLDRLILQTYRYKYDGYKKNIVMKPCTKYHCYLFHNNECRILLQRF